MSKLSTINEAQQKIPLNYLIKNYYIFTIQLRDIYLNSHNMTIM